METVERKAARNSQFVSNFLNQDTPLLIPTPGILKDDEDDQT